jgi:hypothetical protein
MTTQPMMPHPSKNWIAKFAAASKACARAVLPEEMFETSPYAKPGRLGDVIAAIQTMSHYRLYRRTPKDWAGLISGARGGASHWREVFDEHREVFRLSRIHEDEYSLVYRRAKSGKNATSEELEEGEQFEGKNRPPLMPEEISMLIDVALDLQKSMVEARTARRWWVAPVVTVIAGVTTVLVVIFKR